MVDYNTRQRRRNMIVGLFVLVALAAFVWMVWIFRELPLVVSKVSSYLVLVNFTDAPGVQENTPVRYCGYQIGRVINVAPPFRFTDPETGRAYHQVAVTLAVGNDYKDIPSNVQVKLRKRGLGSSYIEFEVDPDETVEDVLRPNDVLQGEAVKGSEFLPEEVQKKIEKLVESVNRLAENTNEIIGDDENKANIKQTLENVKVATAQATETLKSIREFSRGGTEAVELTAEELSEVLVEFRQVLVKLNKKESTAGKILNDGRLYENLLDSSQELQMALEQLKILAAEAREKGIKIKW